jgi:hypothetical protein
VAASWVNGTTFAEEEAATSIAANAPTGLADDDLLLAAVFARSPISAPSGWTSIASLGPYGDFDQYLRVYRKDTTTTSDAGASFTFSQTATDRIGIIYAAATSFSDIAEVASSTGSGVDFHWTPDSLTADEDGELFIVIVSLTYGDSEDQYPAPQSGTTLFSGSGGTSYRIAGAYGTFDTGESNSGAFDVHPTWTDPFALSPTVNPAGSVTIRVSPSGGASRTAYIAVQGILQTTAAAAALVTVTPAAQAAASSPLGTPAVLALHDFTASLGTAVSRYVMDLTGPDGTVRVPISSWQATLRTDGSNYAQCVVPACAPYVDLLNAATSFAILRRVELPSGLFVEAQLASATGLALQQYRGPSRYTTTVSGYTPGFTADADPPASLNRTLTGIRSRSTSSGTGRARCDIDWLLTPGRRAIVDGDELLVDWINYYVNENDAFMDVGEGSS